MVFMWSDFQQAIESVLQKKKGYLHYHEERKKTSDRLNPVIVFAVVPKGKILPSIP